MSPIANYNPSMLTGKPAAPAKIRDAAEQFEALLLGQILRSARESNGTSNDCATEFAEDQLATVLAKRGGLGIGRLIQVYSTSDRAAEIFVLVIVVLSFGLFLVTALRWLENRLAPWSLDR